MNEKINNDTSKKIPRNPSNPKWKSPSTPAPEESENDQTEFGSEEGEELNENESEIDTTVPNKTEVDLDQTGIRNRNVEH